MFRFAAACVLTLVLTSCGSSRDVNICERGLNVEKLFEKLRSLPEHYLIRETTQDFVYSEVNKHPSYLPRSIFVQDTKSKFLRKSWVGRQTITQDCKTNQVITDGLAWNIHDSMSDELVITANNFPAINMRFIQVSENALVIIQTSKSETLSLYEQKTILRWGTELPETENLNISFILGLYEEGINIPDKIVSEMGNYSNNQMIMPVRVEDLLSLQSQIVVLKQR